MGDNVELDLTKITSKKIQKLYPGNYEIFFEMLKEVAKNNEDLRKNLKPIKNLLDYMIPKEQKEISSDEESKEQKEISSDKESKELHKKEKEIICDVCEQLINGIDAREAIKEVKSKRNEFYTKIMGTKVYKRIPHFIRMHVIDIYKVIHHRDNEMLKTITSMVTSEETPAHNLRHKEFSKQVSQFPQRPNGSYLPQPYPNSLTSGIAPSVRNNLYDKFL